MKACAHTNAIMLLLHLYNNNNVFLLQKGVLETLHLHWTNVHISGLINCVLQYSGS